MSKLASLLESIDPSRTIDKIASRIDQAFNSFDRPRPTTDDWNEYEEFLADFFRHLENYGRKSVPELDDPIVFYWGRCEKLLDKAFGPRGYKAAFEMASTGKDGGLYQVLKTIADQLAEEYSQNTISALVSNYYNSLTHDEKLTEPDEYIRDYGHLLPPKMTEGSAVRVRGFFPRVLEEHPRMIRRMRQIRR